MRLFFRFWHSGFSFNEGGRWLVITMVPDIVYFAVAVRWDNSKFFRLYRSRRREWTWGVR